MKTKPTRRFISMMAVACLGTVTSPAQDAAPMTTRLSFLNGDSFSGQIENWKEGRIVVKNPSVKQSVDLRTDNLLKIDLQSSESEDSKPEKKDHEAIISIQHRFGNEQAHDQLKGQLVQVTDESITIDTDYAGEITVDRKFIVNMEITSQNSHIYSGPNSLEEWYQHDDDGSWNYKNASLISGGTSGGQISKDIGLDDLSHLSFYMDWKSSLNLKLLLYSDDFESTRPSNYYELVMRNSYIYMRKVTSEDGSDPMDGSTSVRQLSGMDTTYVEIFMNKKKGTFEIYFDGEKIAELSDRNASPENFGSALHFLSDQRAPIRIRNLRLSRWSGRLPTNDDENAFKKLKGEGQRILLKNGDAIIGQLGKVQNGVLKVETKYTPIPIPVAAMRSIYMKSSDKHQPKKEPQDVKAYFKNGGWVILKLISLDASKLTGYHQAFGEKTFSLDAFSQIEFNIYDPNMNAVRVGPSW
ncbi:hypothetical protein SAMN02745181_2704 [Rubritalea squalenifaciens DSM 18772]|uniref:Uncharacterized protein n=1 Tax=Rubritalea squalenifaciens DSM 18772 TaxID=1123071 RepID=A0A1M6ME82_9BACT|nr:hypothetical protein [Rubritalea squalenifaciens]SHJ81781.1 hypothetical protein SAMN02745181_2704 [Rubritalea squalenifaciens DSM 18772]